MSITPLPCPKCGNKIWQGPRYVPPVKAITQWSEVLRPAEDDQLSYTCTDCRFVRYEVPNDRKPVKTMQSSDERSEMGPEWVLGDHSTVDAEEVKRSWARYEKLMDRWRAKL